MTPSRCPNCGFASLFLDPFLLSRMRVGVWDTSTLFVQVDFSKAGRWNMAGEPPFFRQRAERSGTSPLRHLLQLEGCLQRTARRRAPCGGCQNISRLPQATEYQEYLAGTELEFRLSKQAFCDKSTRWDSIYPRRISQLRIVEFQRADGMAG